MRRAPRPLRSSFVLTVAVATVAAACGGSVATSPDEGRGDARDPESGPGPGCATTPPIPTTACEGSLVCNYAWCPYGPGGGYWGTEAKCLDGKWSTMTTSCNPPPPPSECPTTEPRPGTSCSVIAYNCGYTDTCAPDRSALEYLMCSGGVWTMRDGDYTAACPKTAPAHGTSCLCGVHLAPARCTYADSCGAESTIAACDPKTATWNVGISTCNPPFVDGGIDAGSVEVGPADARSGD
jgi:hypothetical protein